MSPSASGTLSGLKMSVRSSGRTAAVIADRSGNANIGIFLNMQSCIRRPRLPLGCMLYSSGDGRSHGSAVSKFASRKVNLLSPGAKCSREFK